MRRTHVTALSAAAALGVAALTLCLAQADPIRPTNQGNYIPPARTEAGQWDGTWFYESRDGRVVLWIRGGDKPEVRMRFHSTQDTEAFLTEWDGDAKYTLLGRPAEFRLDLTEADANVMRGTWYWEVQGDRARRETAKVTIYRTGDGRSLVIVFDEFLRVVTLGDREMHITAPHGWSFLKASKRHVAYEEIPF
jgi:hypothetical protein